MLVSSDNSPIILLSTPTFPFNSPAIHRLYSLEVNRSVQDVETPYLMTSPVKVFERPKQSIDIQIPATPVRRTGFLPIKSEARPQCSTVAASARKNKDCLTRNH